MLNLNKDKAEFIAIIQSRNYMDLEKGLIGVDVYVHTANKSFIFNLIMGGLKYGIRMLIRTLTI